jgi:hypothetical protein
MLWFAFAFGLCIVTVTLRGFAYIVTVTLRIVTVTLRGFAYSYSYIAWFLRTVTVIVIVTVILRFLCV